MDAAENLGERSEEFKGATNAAGQAKNNEETSAGTGREIGNAVEDCTSQAKDAAVSSEGPGFGAAGKDADIKAPVDDMSGSLPEEYGAADDEFVTRTYYPTTQAEQKFVLAALASAAAGDEGLGAAGKDGDIRAPGEDIAAASGDTGFGAAGKDGDIRAPVDDTAGSLPEEYGAADDEFVTRTNYSPSDPDEKSVLATSGGDKGPGEGTYAEALMNGIPEPEEKSVPSAAGDDKGPGEGTYVEALMNEVPEQEEKSVPSAAGDDKGPGEGTYVEALMNEVPEPEKKSVPSARGDDKGPGEGTYVEALMNELHEPEEKSVPAAAASDNGPGEVTHAAALMNEIPST
ncbi:unnamed protein product [Calypogeia fissa]